ncbi:Protein TAR1 [Capsicum baccatum]|uniref:Protein TAR1 n=1 Tax=Capsicum baccatum TaxID=33114 RepID=A0A2G2UZZ5_CAPBA|nr:Protein TAR1 [Capsicum baccatum]
MPKHAGGARCLPQSRRRRSTSVSRARALAAPPIHAGPRPESIGGPARRRSTSDRGASPAPIRFPPDNFKHSLTLFSKSFSSFPRGTCSLSVSRPYLALDGIHRPIWAAFPNNPTRRQSLVGRQGPGMTGLSPSPAPPSRGLGPGLRSERLSAKGSWSPDARRAVATMAKRVELQPPLAATSVDLDSHLGQPRARGAREASIRPATTTSPVIEARCEGATRCMTPRQTCPRPNVFGCNLRSKTRWFMGFYNSHQVLHFAMLFIDARAEISVAESRFRLQKKHRSDRRCVQRMRSHSLMELTIQIAPPTKNGHAPPPIESRKSSQSVNPYYVCTCRIPLVRTSSELAVRRAGKAPEGTVPSPSPGRHAATRSRRGSSSSSPPTADGFGTGTPVPSPQSQSFSRSYGSILPTSLAYIVPSTRGCSPWRPDAVMSTTGRGRHSVLRIFKGRRERTGHHATCGALPAAGPYLRLSRFQVLAARTKAPPRPKSSASSPVMDDATDNRHERTMKRRRCCYTGTDGSHGLAKHAAMRPCCSPISFLAPYGFTRPLTRTHVRLLGP